MSKKRKNRPRRRRPGPAKASSTEPIDISKSELEAIVERAKGALSDKEYEILQAVIKTLSFLTQELGKKRVSIKRLKQLLFGAPTETLRKVFGEAAKQHQSGKQQADKPAKDKPAGHGRNGADKYTGAEKVQVPHQTLRPGQKCPDCGKGTVYEAPPAQIVRVSGQAPLNAKVYQLQKLRCNLCGKVFTAAAPEHVGEKKYDAESAAMIALLKYGSGLPFNRLQRLQGNLGIPLPAATQWDILADCIASFDPAYEQMIRTAAEGRVIHNDDTAMKVLELAKDQTQDEEENGRKGVFTSGIVSVSEGHRIALFFTGNKHAGENLADVLKHRASRLAAPIHMCDALSRNTSPDFEAILANCLAHGRRRFTDVSDAFPAECLYVLELLAKVYKNDQITRQDKLSDQDRLVYHQMHSKPLMDELKQWMTQQLDQKLTEPNSSLGEAIRYMLKHWQKLTLFLRQPGAPLDNNVCERALKKAILHRKNSYFYKTTNGARVGDLFMSLIHTCELNGVNAFDYLTHLQKHAAAVASSPAD